MRGELDTGLGAGPEPDLTTVTGVVARQQAEGLHDCAQLYVSLAGEPLLDAALGESHPGRALQTDDVMLWYLSLIHISEPTRPY